MVDANLILLFSLLALGVVLSVYAKKLTFQGALCGAGIAASIYLSTSFKGIILLASFFILAVWASSWKKAFKEQYKLEEANNGRRNAGQVFANGGVAALSGIAGYLWPDYQHVFILMLASSLSSATADTISSEMGNIYGNKFFNILSFKPDRRGLDGVISLEGTLFGIAASAIVSIAFSIFYGWGILSLIIVAAGTVGNLTDSVLGAALERRQKLNNDMVNFLNTLVGALASFLLYQVLI